MTVTSPSLSAPLWARTSRCGRSEASLEGHLPGGMTTRPRTEAASEQLFSSCNALREAQTGLARLPLRGPGTQLPANLTPSPCHLHASSYPSGRRLEVSLLGEPHHGLVVDFAVCRPSVECWLLVRPHQAAPSEAVLVEHSASAPRRQSDSSRLKVNS